MSQAEQQPEPTTGAAAADDQAATERLEIGEIGLVQAVRIADRPGIGPAQAACQVGTDGWLHHLELAARQLLMVDAERR